MTNRPISRAGLALILSVVGTTPHLYAQAFPSKPLELVVHTAPGGGSDQFTRLVGDIITRQKLLAQPVTIVNKGGGGGAIALGYVGGKQGDPHTVLAVATTVFLGAPLRTGLDIGLDKFRPLALFGFDLNCLAVREEAPYRTLKDFVEAVKANPDTIVAIGSVGGTAHYLLYLIEKSTGAKFKTVSFKRGGDAMLAVLGGPVQATAENLSEVMQQVEAKKLRILAVGSENRLPTAPNVPTFKEQGMDIRAGVGRGFASPAGVPREAAAALEATFAELYKSAAWREYATRNMYEDVYMNGAEFARYLSGRQAELHQYFNDIGLVKKK